MSDFAARVAVAAEVYVQGERRARLACFHLGRVLDRLGCNCPRRWIRQCDVHDRASLRDCQYCPDYEP